MFRKRNEEENEEQILCSDRSWAVRDDGSPYSGRGELRCTAIDDKDDNVQDIAEKVSYAVKADVRDPGILESLGVQNVDVAVIAVAENMEASITATMQVKELGVPFVMAKAMNSLHGRILEKIGADKVIYPEHSMGIRVARNLLSSGFVDMFELSSDFSMAEFKIPREWIGKHFGS